jgi:hypothetical protein
MQARVLALVAVNVDGDLLDQVKGLAVGGLKAFQVGPEDVVGLSGGNALGKLTMMVGVEFPANFLGFIRGAPNLHGYAVKGAIIWAPDGSKDEGVRLVLVFARLPSRTLEGRAEAEEKGSGKQESKRREP